MAQYILTHLTPNPYLITVLLLLGCLVYKFNNESQVYEKFEYVRGGVFQRKEVHEIVHDGYHTISKRTKRPFVVNWWAKRYIIMPTHYLADLKTADWGHLSFFTNISDALFLHTTVGDLYTSHKSERMVDIVKRDINPRLPQLAPIMKQEVDSALEKTLGEFTGWKEVNTMALLSRVAHQTATRVLIGEELCNNESFIKLTTSFLESIFVTALIIVKLPLGPFRGFLASPLSLVHKWKLYRCKKILLPIVKRRIAERKGHKGNPADVLDGIEWTLARVPEGSLVDTPETITTELLHALWAGSSAPGGMMTEVIYQMLLGEEYQETMRTEAIEAFQKFGWGEKMINVLHCQDSFIREVNRLYPTGAITCSRTVVNRPFKFSDGLVLPVGARLGFPIKASQSDADNFKDPDKFDGFRFLQQGTAEGGTVENKRVWSAASMDINNLAWGYGNHICPGRFFAVREIKMVLTKLLLKYDIKWQNKNRVRPPPIHVEGQFIPNMKQTIFLKRRESVAVIDMI
ncbi:cytochrome P450 [Amylocarpus encephaloides]|uniref:Cytochrome P450 n=1 Tax=Amylocarpus encephaloides TaxID=45428 RepID=A0A9P7YD61_9HELO|nr:cytochrome P450 [Amylocarpus encephaloides]